MIKTHEFLKTLKSTPQKMETEKFWILPNKFPPFFYKELWHNVEDICILEQKNHVKISINSLHSEPKSLGNMFFYVLWSFLSFINKMEKQLSTEK